MTTLATHVNTLTSSDFDPTDVTNAITTATTYVSAYMGETVSENQSDGSDMAISMLAVAILQEARMVLQSRTNDRQARSVAELFSAEMKELLMKEDEDDSIAFSNDNPVKDWAYPYGT